MWELALLSLVAAALRDVQEKQKDQRTPLQKRFDFAFDTMLEAVRRVRNAGLSSYRMESRVLVEWARLWSHLLGGVRMVDRPVSEFDFKNTIGTSHFYSSTDLGKLIDLYVDGACRPQLLPEVIATSRLGGYPANVIGSMLVWSAREFTRPYSAWAKARRRTAVVVSDTDFMSPFRASLDEVALQLGEDRAVELADWIEADHPDLSKLDLAQAIAASKTWHDQFAKSAGFRTAVAPGLRLMTFSDGSHVDRLLTKAQLEDEGESMGHCVDGYWSSVRDNRSIILSYRDAGDVPWITVEVHGTIKEGLEVNQFFGPQNARVPEGVRRDRMIAFLLRNGINLESERLLVVPDPDLAVMEAIETYEDAVVKRWDGPSSGPAFDRNLKNIDVAYKAVESKLAEVPEGNPRRDLLRAVLDTGLSPRGNKNDADEFSSLAGEIEWQATRWHGDEDMTVADLSEDVRSKLDNFGIDYDEGDHPVSLRRQLDSDAEFRMQEDYPESVVEALKALGAYLDATRRYTSLDERKQELDIGDVGKIEVLDDRNTSWFQFQGSEDDNGQGVSPLSALLEAGVVTTIERLRQSAKTSLQGSSPVTGDDSKLLLLTAAPILECFEVAKELDVLNLDMNRTYRKLLTSSSP